MIISPQAAAPHDHDALEEESRNEPDFTYDLEELSKGAEGLDLGNDHEVPTVTVTTLFSDPVISEYSAFLKQTYLCKLRSWCTARHLMPFRKLWV